MNIHEICKAFLKAVGADGLCNNLYDGCSCLLDDLTPCSGLRDFGLDPTRCVAARRVPCDCQEKDSDRTCALGYHLVPMELDPAALSALVEACEDMLYDSWDSARLQRALSALRVVKELPK